MGLNLVKVETGGGGGDRGNFVKTTTLKDYPLVAIRMKRTGKKLSYEKTHDNDTITADFVCLNDKDKVVFTEKNGLWELSRSRNTTTGEMKSSYLFRLLGGLAPGSVVAGTIYIPDGFKANVWDNVDVTPAQLKAIEDAFNEMGDDAPKAEGWANKGDELPDFLR